MREEYAKRALSIDNISKGSRIKPKPDLPPAELLSIYYKITSLGGTYSAVNYSFLIPRKASSDQILQHIEKLRILFQTSRKEIRESLVFLINNELSIEEISIEIGASRATIYRYIK